jgi:hypothetical protein
VLVEPFVLDSDDRVLEVLGDRVDRDDLAVLEVEVREELAVGGVDLGRLCDRERVRVIDVGKALEGVHHERVGHTCARDQEHEEQRDQDREHATDRALALLLTLPAHPA